MSEYEGKYDKPFCLEDKTQIFLTGENIILGQNGKRAYLETDIKQAIKLLKEKVKQREDYLEENYTSEDTVMSSEEVMKIVETIFGKGLCE